jgi:hypothetical protein
MALIKSTILSAIRGSINGTVFAQNKSGAYARNRTVPVNPNTTNQQAVRIALGQAAMAWKTLSAERRAAWDAYAAGTPVPNRLGDIIHLSGFNMFCKARSFLAFCSGNLTLAETAPESPGLAPGFSLDEIVVRSNASVVPEDNTLGLVLDTPTEQALENGSYAVWRSDPLSPGVTFYKGPWKLCVARFEHTFVAPDVYPSISIPMNTNVIAGQFYAFRMRLLTEDMRLSQDAIIAPTEAVTTT